MPDAASVTLQTPIEVRRGDEREAIGRLELREPTGSDLRGIMLSNLLQGATASVAKLIPRIATPYVTPDQIERLPMRYQVALWGAVMGFFGDGAATEIPEVPET